MKIYAAILFIGLASNASAGTIVQDLYGGFRFIESCDRHYCYIDGAESSGHSIFNLYDNTSQPLNYVTIQFAGRFWRPHRAGYVLQLGFNYSGSMYMTPGLNYSGLHQTPYQNYFVVNDRGLRAFEDFPGSNIDNRLMGFFGTGRINKGTSGLTGVNYAVRLTYGFGDDIVPPSFPDAPIAPVPLPASLPLSAMALLGLSLWSRWKKKAASFRQRMLALKQ